MIAVSLSLRLGSGNRLAEEGEGKMIRCEKKLH